MLLLLIVEYRRYKVCDFIYLNRNLNPPIITVQENKTRLFGDVDFESCQGIASWITPVPGGVGPLTVAMLM